MLLFLLLLCHDTQRMKSAGWSAGSPFLPGKMKETRRLYIAQTIRDLYNHVITTINKNLNN